MLSENLLCICFNTEAQKHRDYTNFVPLCLCVYKKRSNSYNLIAKILQQHTFYITT
ncbi:hypothetical protein EZS27_024050 [termite gut metagenome]|uniref:Uncharacterized protein n=1 Tax=termite gut metagenome TaxID=433724 RepID=A0A5J4QYX4_9ZZZZ